MVQGYYTLDEAAQILGLTTDKLSQMAQKREIRAFADRGTWRFRTQDIEEMARRLGRGSHPDLQLGEAKPSASASPAPKSGAKSPSPAPSPKSSAKLGTPKPADSGKSGDPGVFSFDIGSEQVDLGHEIVIESPSSRRKAGKSPSPKPGSDSDVKLVPDESDVDFRIPADDSKAKPASPKSKSPGAKKKTDSSGPIPAKPSSSRKSGLGPVIDSGVRLVPMEDEAGGASPPPPKSPSDSDIRIETPGSSSKLVGGEPFLTEEIDLDAELRKADEASRSKRPGAKPKKGQAPSTEFEIEGASPAPKAGPAAKKPTPKPTPRPKASPAAAGEDEVALGELTPGDLSDISGNSGINLSAPADSGINLEKEGGPASGKDKIEFEMNLDEVPATPKPAPEHAEDDSSSEFELSLDVEATPKPVHAQQEDDSSSEFELSLDVESTPKPAVEEDDSSSEFELSLDVESTPKPVPAAPEGDSSSEFELTLDDSGQLAPIDEAGEEASGEKDIFETDFEVPALEESSSEAVAVDESDTALESSDFDLSLGDEESGSQVVALDDEEAVDEEAATAARPALSDADLDEEPAEVDELLAEDELATAPEEEGEEVAAGPVVAGRPASWGIVAPAGMVLSTILMIVVCLMSFELIHSMWGYRQPSGATGWVTNGLARQLNLIQAQPSGGAPKK
jgi:excisionase family DNA binding protein